jgi:hypothetical protein
MTQAANVIPEGYMKNGVGHLVPTELVKDIDKLRDQTVRRIVEAALVLAPAIRGFKEATDADIAAFTGLSAEQFGTTLGGVKGNITLCSFDGQYKVCKDIGEFFTYDERMQVAKALVDECIESWGNGADPKYKALVTHAFQVNKHGKVNLKKVLALRQLNIEDPVWKRAMDAISDSIQVAGKKAYVRIYQRQDDGSYKQINLDLASL